MKFKKIDLHLGAGKVYGLLLGVFVVGLHLRAAPNGPRLVFRRAKMRKDPAYGFLTGSAFWGLYKPPTASFLAFEADAERQTERKLQLDAMLSATKQDIRWANDVLRLEVSGHVGSPAAKAKLADILSGKEELLPFRTEAEEYEDLVKNRARTVQLGAAFPSTGPYTPRNTSAATELSRKNLAAFREAQTAERAAALAEARREREAEWAAEEADVKALRDALSSPPKISS